MCDSIGRISRTRRSISPSSSMMRGGGNLHGGAARPLVDQQPGAGVIEMGERIVQRDRRLLRSRCAMW